jgi:hypothetical protein
MMGQMQGGQMGAGMPGGMMGQMQGGQMGAGMPGGMMGQMQGGQMGAGMPGGMMGQMQGGQMGAGMPGGMMGQMQGGQGMPGAPGGEGAGQPGGPGQPGGLGGEARVATSKVRILLETEEGPLILEDYEINPDYTVNGWTKVLIPLSEFLNLKKVDANKLKRIVLFGDAEDEFYIGRARFVIDDDPMQVGLWPAQDFDTDIKIDLLFQGWALYGNLFAGEVGLSLDFGDGTPVLDLIKEKRCQPGTNAFAVPHAFTKEGDFNVTLTVTDPTGVKPPITKTIIARAKDY